MEYTKGSPNSSSVHEWKSKWCEKSSNQIKHDECIERPNRSSITRHGWIINVWNVVQCIKSRNTNANNWENGGCIKCIIVVIYFLNILGNKLLVTQQTNQKKIFFRVFTINMSDPSRNIEKLTHWSSWCSRNFR